MLDQFVEKRTQKHGALRLKLMEIYWQLNLQKSLEPSVQVNKLFEALVEAIGDDNCDCIEKDDWLDLARPNFNLLCARGEELLEKYWVDKFLAEERLSWEKLEEFVYFENYRFLAEWEYALMGDYLGYAPKRILFVGSGSLPLSAMLMARIYGVVVDCIDMNQEAVLDSQRLIEKIGLQEKVRVKRMDFLAMENFEGYDVVMIAALVGRNEVEKKKVLVQLKKNLQPQQAFLKRTVIGLKRLFYQQVRPEWLDGFSDVRIFHPRGEVINSVILAKNL